MAKKETPTGLYLVAIVSIVAVIGLIVMVLNYGGASAGLLLSDEDLAGQASGKMYFLKLKVVRDAEGNVVSVTKDCQAITAACLTEVNYNIHAEDPEAQEVEFCKCMQREGCINYIPSCKETLYPQT